MAAPKTILITAGSGNTGRVLTPLLLKQNPAPKLILPTNSVERLKTNNPGAADSNVIAEEGSIRDPIWFESILQKHNVEAVFLCVTDTDEMFTGMNCLDAISKVGTVKKVVYLSIVGDFLSDAGVKSVFRDRTYAHIFSKVVIEQKLLHGNFPFAWTALGPSFFFVNDLRQKMPLMEMGLFAEPSLEKGMSKVSSDDVALAVRNALFDTSGKWNSKKVNLGSKHSYTTVESAEIWSKALGKPIKTQSSSKETLDQLENTIRGVRGPAVDGLAWARDLRLLFEYAIAYGVHIPEADYKDQVELLGKEPDDYTDWVKKTVATWL